MQHPHHPLAGRVAWPAKRAMGMAHALALLANGSAFVFLEGRCGGARFLRFFGGHVVGELFLHLFLGGGVVNGMR